MENHRLKPHESWEGLSAVKDMSLEDYLKYALDPKEEIFNVLQNI